jgi:hypothetical protein
MDSIIRLFVTLGKHERNLDKDFVDFNLNDVINLFEINAWTKSNTFASRKSILKQYVKWCESLNKVSSIMHPIFQLKNEDIKGLIKISSQYIKDFDELKDCYNHVYESLDEEDTSQFIYQKTGYNLSFLGFMPEEIRFMQRSHVSFATSSIRSPFDNNYVVNNVNDEIMGLIDECINYDGCVAHNKYGYYKAKYQISNFIIRVKASKSAPDGTPVEPHWFGNSINIFKRRAKLLDVDDIYYGKGLTFESVRFCGDCDRLYKLSKTEDIEKDINQSIAKTSRILADSPMIFFRWSDYQDWRKYFYGV